MRAVIFANGQLDPWPAGLKLSPGHDLIIAADGGLKHCRRWGIAPDIVVGDMDSADPEDLAALEASGTEMVRYPTRKDETDLELALKLAIDRGSRDIVVAAALGARWDMTFSNVLLLAAPFLDETTVRLLAASSEIVCLKGGGSLRLTGRPGDLVSLLPLTGDALGVTLSGLAYPLENAVLPMGSSLGVSNAFTEPVATVALRKGRVLITVTHAPEPAPRKAPAASPI